jgi:hypothetical protein
MKLFNLLATVVKEWRPNYKSSHFGDIRSACNIYNNNNNKGKIRHESATPPNYVCVYIYIYIIIIIK